MWLWPLKSSDLSHYCHGGIAEKLCSFNVAQVAAGRPCGCMPSDMLAILGTRAILKELQAGVGVAWKLSRHVQCA